MIPLNKLPLPDHTVRRRAKATAGALALRHNTLAKRARMNSTKRPIALITGASSGVGIELARELARQGHDLVLAARSVEPMDRLAGERRSSGINVTGTAGGLSQPGEAAVVRPRM